MSTTPSTSKPEIAYTVFGGAQKARIHKDPYPLCIVVLHRQGRLHRDSALLELTKNPDYEVISVEDPEAAPEIDSLVKKYPHVRFLLLQSQLTAGEKLNLVMDEAESKHVLAIWSDIHAPASSLSLRILEKIIQRDFLCATPVLKTQKLETVPTVQVPAFTGHRLKILPWNPLHDGMKSVFPYDFTGIYSREKFRFCGGFDHRIKSPYWQMADFGFRSFLWGEEISVTTSLYFQYRDETPLLDHTPDTGYKLFYLKNMSIDFRNDRGILSIRRFPGYLLKSGTSFLRALHEFRDVQKWVGLRKYRYKLDARSLVDLWEPPE
ncbi:MAG: hypothetical protein EHM28_10010 [Spirochaetaceae bacterium]|nr:MAG: hypothetical protein EHM28_10010 [Spirochaetaceae bacterium]